MSKPTERKRPGHIEREGEGGRERGRERETALVKIKQKQVSLVLAEHLQHVERKELPNTSQNTLLRHQTDVCPTCCVHSQRCSPKAMKLDEGDGVVSHSVCLGCRSRGQASRKPREHLQLGAEAMKQGAFCIQLYVCHSVLSKARS